jgi:hypothetical protein
MHLNHQKRPRLLYTCGRKPASLGSHPLHQSPTCARQALTIFVIHPSMLAILDSLFSCKVRLRQCWELALANDKNCHLNLVLISLGDTSVNPQKPWPFNSYQPSASKSTEWIDYFERQRTWYWRRSDLDRSCHHIELILPVNRPSPLSALPPYTLAHYEVVTSAQFWMGWA